MAILVYDDDDTLTLTDLELMESVDNGADPDPNVTYTIRKIQPEKEKEFTRKHTSKPNYRRAAEVNWIGVAEDKLDYLLIGWSGYVNKRTGQPLECNRANKLRAIDVVRRLRLIDRASLSEVASQEDARGQSFP